MKKRFLLPMGSRHRLMLLCGAAALTSACAVGPNYKRPQTAVTAEFKEQDGWKPSQPADAINRGAWWEIFNDPVLNDLEAQVNVSNQTILAQIAAVENARALLSESVAGLFPSVDLSASDTKSKFGGGSTGGFGGLGAGTGAGGAAGTGTSTGATGTGTGAGTSFPSTTTTKNVGASLSYTLDIWGQLRRTVESSRASFQASEAQLASARLSEQSLLATTYFELRAQDQLQALFDDIVDAEQKSFDITQARFRTGVAAKTDVVTAQTQLLASQASQVNNQVQRGVFEHAIAVLVGKNPAEVSIKPTTMRSDVPTIPAGVPSALLERRPDIAAAERQVAAANAQIGVAISAWFPSLTLTGNVGYSGIAGLFSAANQTWSIGPALALNIFDGGLRNAQVKAARATWEEDVANYRQTVLAGIQQVEDELVTLRVLEKVQVIQDDAVKAAKESEDLNLADYKAGTVNYINVIQAQTARFDAEETALNVLLERLEASVTLIQAVGGGWNSSELNANAKNGGKAKPDAPKAPGTGSSAQPASPPAAPPAANSPAPAADADGSVAIVASGNSVDSGSSGSDSGAGQAVKRDSGSRRGTL